MPGPWVAPAIAAGSQAGLGMVGRKQAERQAQQQAAAASLGQSIAGIEGAQVPVNPLEQLWHTMSQNQGMRF